MKFHSSHIVKIGLLLPVFVLMACNSKGYQNLNARYNGYFYANQYVNEVYQAIEDQYEYNFNDVLKVFPEIDSSTIQANEEKLDDAFKKSSQVIEWYSGSDWVDDNYIVIGKIRYLRAQFQFARETFQYVYQNSQDDNAKQQALILLMRTYMDNGDFDRAVEVTDYIKREELTAENEIAYKLQLAYLHQVQSDNEALRDALNDVHLDIKDRDLKARVNFILGQLAEKSGDINLAMAYYDEAIKGTPPYELLFHTQIKKQGVQDIRTDAQAEKAYKTFDKLLKDGKNFEYQDKIYYAMGQMEQKRGRYKEAIAHYKTGTQVEQPNQRTQGLSYLRIAEIYYSYYEQYQNASVYYDSTVMKLPKDEENYEAIAKRQEVLKDLVVQLNVIDEKDSLLSLAEMNPVSLDAYLDKYLDEKEAAEKAAEAKERAKNKSSFAGANIAQSGDAPNASSDGSWYFYNDAAISQGQQEFQRAWGNRPLEDNWRRSQKAVIGIASAQPDESPEDEAVEEAVTDEPATPDRADEKAKLLATIPQTEAAKTEARQAVATAYFELGRIYRFGLERLDLSEESYKTLLSKFPETEHRLDALYALYTLSETSDVTTANNYKNTIIADYPDSLIAKLLINPNYLLEKEQRNMELQRVYAEAYDAYEAGNYIVADQKIRSALNDFEDVDFLPTVELLAAMLKGHTENMFAYEKALNEYTEKYPEGQLHDYAKTLLAAINPAKEDIVRSPDFEFSEDFRQQHLVAITFETANNKQADIKAVINAFNQENFADERLNIGYLEFNKEAGTGILFISPFKTKAAAQTYNLLLEKALVDQKPQTDTIFHNFAISQDNFSMLFQSKALEKYLQFNKRFYQ